MAGLGVRWALALTVGYAAATIDRTGRASQGSPKHRLSSSVKCVTVQLGGKGELPGDVHGRVEKDVILGPVRTHVTCRFAHPSEKTPLDTVSFAGNLGDIGYEAAYNNKEGGTDLQLAYSLPSGVQLMADAKMLPTGQRTLDRLSAFHVAGPFNLQPSFLLNEQKWRIKLGRGGRWNRCPLSVQADLDKDGTPSAYEVGMRHEFVEGRKMKARLLLPGVASARQLWAEYQDAKIEKGSVWFARATVPLGEETDSRGSGGDAGGLLSRSQFSLRRAWQW
jgi:hypothetical protein